MSNQEEGFAHLVADAYSEGRIIGEIAWKPDVPSLIWTRIAGIDGPSFTFAKHQLSTAQQASLVSGGALLADFFGFDINLSWNSIEESNRILQRFPLEVDASERNSRWHLFKRHNK